MAMFSGTQFQVSGIAIDGSASALASVVSGLTPGEYVVVQGQADSRAPSGHAADRPYSPGTRSVRQASRPRQRCGGTRVRSLRRRTGPRRYLRAKPEPDLRGRAGGAWHRESKYHGGIVPSRDQGLNFSGAACFSRFLFVLGLVFAGLTFLARGPT